ncbi:DnaD domain protein [Breznakia pachnodae]|uniref:Replication initiation and membrane attachment protein n=1 Tax=Breznakia pachnodae TaxID=265178 RepID=A0ABU0E789_9FIRM|nr:DnaD domain protein [Breznakia pachnodae]MDQ0362774.1 replication initiation and membrane attachment protein [Breznakia pachnodae]
MLKQEDKLTIEIHGVINEESHAVLSMLYYPLIKEKAFLLYHLLVSLCENKMTFENHRIIHAISGFSMEVIEEERKRLEKYQLLKTYYDSKKNQYLYAIIPPKSGTDFLEHEVFGRLYLNNMGEQVVKFQKLNFLPQIVDKDQYKDISECISDVLRDDWNESFEETYQQVKKDIKNSKQEFASVFNYDEFLNGLSDIVWPKKSRSKKAMEEIGKIATVYGISPKQMKVLVAKSCSPKDKMLDLALLREKAAASRAKFETDEVNIYKWPPVRFMQNKQNGAPVSKADAETIRVLLEDYKLNPEVCNVLIEYVLNTSEQKFVRNYVESIAGSWVRAKVDTYEKAVERIHRPTSKTGSKIKKVEVKEEGMSEEERQKILDEINAMKGQMGNGKV